VAAMMFMPLGGKDGMVEEDIHRLEFANGIKLSQWDRARKGQSSTASYFL
jgi:hypothetical protein